MASSTQTVVDKGKPNLLIVESLLKILREPILLSPPKSLIIPWNGKDKKAILISPAKRL